MLIGILTLKKKVGWLYIFNYTIIFIIFYDQKLTRFDLGTIAELTRKKNRVILLFASFYDYCITEETTNKEKETATEFL